MSIWWNNITDSGVGLHLSSTEIRNTKLVNYLSLMFFFLLSLCLCYKYIYGVKEVSFFCYVAAISFSLPILLNQYAKYYTAKNIFLTIQLIFPILAASIYGASTGIEYSLIGVIVYPFLFYRKRSLHFTFLGLAVVAFCICKYLYTYTTPLFTSIDPLTHGILNSLTFASFVIIFIGMAIFKDESNKFEKKSLNLLLSLKNKNQRLEEQQELLKEEIEVRKKAEDYAVAQERYMRSIISNMPVALYAIKKDGMIVLAEGQKLSEDLPRLKHKKGENAFKLFQEHPILLNAIKQGLTGKQFNEQIQIGTTYFQSSFTPIFDGKGDCECTICVAVDITPIKAYEQKLENSNKELEQFAYVASHDLKEPLRMIGCYTQLLQKRLADQLTKETVDFMWFITDGVVRMQSLLDDLLEYSRVGRFNTQKENVPLDDVVAIIEHNLKFKIEENNVSIIKHQKLPTLETSPNQMIQLFQNLITNAIKFKNGKDPVIEINHLQQDSKHIISIKDNGIGIDPVFQKKVFGLFQRYHPKGNCEGSGIGLSICKKIVEWNGGNIWFDSTLNEGTTFYIALPNQKNNTSQIINKPINEKSMIC